MPWYRDEFVASGGERLDIFRTGDKRAGEHGTVRLEIHTDTGTVMWDFSPADARRLGTAIALAGRVEPTETSREGK